MTDREVKQRLTLKLGSLVKETLAKNDNNKSRRGLQQKKSKTEPAGLGFVRAIGNGDGRFSAGVG
jgi:hypothetical protein